MKIIPIKTHKIKAFEEDIFLILDKYVRRMPEGSILAVTSKIISLCEGRVVKIGDVDKDELIKSEAEVYLKRKFRLKRVGVVITDSKTTPLRMGTSGVAIAHSGFEALLDYIGTPDIFGRKLKMTKANIMDALAAAAVLVMGEGAEQTPLAIIEDLPFVKFKSSDPSKSELRDLKIELDDDLYAPMLKAVKWRKGLRPVG